MISSSSNSLVQRSWMRQRERVRTGRFRCRRTIVLHILRLCIFGLEKMFGLEYRRNPSSLFSASRAMTPYAVTLIQPFPLRSHISIFGPLGRDGQMTTVPFGTNDAKRFRYSSLWEWPGRKAENGLCGLQLLPHPWPLDKTIYRQNKVSSRLLPAAHKPFDTVLNL